VEFINMPLIKSLLLKILALAIIIGLSDHAAGEPVGQSNKAPRQVPFKLERNRVIIPVRINKSRAFNVILDTGMRFDGVYLFHEKFTDEIDMADAIEVRVGGAGAGEASTAMMIESGHLAFGDVEFANQKVIISRSSHTQGFPTDGVIGWNLFGHYTVQIDYDREIITLLDTTDIHRDTTWHSVPITLKDDIPFLEAAIGVVDGEQVPVSLYIDLASGDALELLTRPDQKFTMPENLEEKYLGTGLSGDINGYYGRCKLLRIGSYELHDIKTAFAPSEVRSKQRGADGILGNDSIRRFNVIFDYAHNRLHIKPNSFFKTPFD
jgi:hypothetical protein